MFNVGQKVLVRTVTNYFTGRVVAVDDTFVELEEAAWIADTGRFADALTTGKLNEVEPYPGSVFVGLGAVVDFCDWPHDLPRVQK